MKPFTITSDLTVSKVQQCGNDAMLAAAAWVSTDAAEALERARVSPEDVPGVLSFLIKHRHGTPFEHGFLTVYTHLPIFVYREWHRHRVGFSYNEESARYKQLDPVFYFPPKHRPLLKVDKWKPGRPKFEIGGDDNEMRAEHEGVYRHAYATYEKWLGRQVDPGIAREVLPVGIFSSCWISANPRSIMHFLSLRVHKLSALFISYPQWEIDQAAQKLEAIFAEHWPLTHKFFCENQRVAP